jgi:hypothetical protein
VYMISFAACLWSYEKLLSRVYLVILLRLVCLARDFSICNIVFHLLFLIIILSRWKKISIYRVSANS